MTTNRTTMNNEIKMAILEKLFAVEATHTYGFAIRDNGMVKAAIVENADDVIPFITVCERNSKSHGGVYGVRMWNSNKAFEIIKEYAREIITLCTVEEFERQFKEAKENGFKGNRGDFFEPTFAKATGAKLNTVRNEKCTDGGDVNLNGEEIQLKLWNATLTTEPQANTFYERMIANKAE